MIVWSGRGFLIIVVLLAILFSCVSIFSDSNADYSFIISFYVTGIFSFIFGRIWNNQTIRTFIDKETGLEVNLKANHTLFWIKMEYWSVLFFVIAIIILFQNLDENGFQFYLNIILIVIGFAVLFLFGIILFKSKNINNFQIESVETKSKIEIVPKSNFIKEEMKEITFEKEDHNRFIPK